MEKALEDVFPFLNFPSDFSKLSLDELDNLSKKIGWFFLMILLITYQIFL